MKEIIADKKLIAYCGLFCGSCRSYLKGSCPGCAGNEKASWCKIRTCNMEHSYASCAECKEYQNAMDCKRYNNFMSKMIGFLLKSDRNACISMIKSNGYDNFASYMAENRIRTIRKK